MPIMAGGHADLPLRSLRFIAIDVGGNGQQCQSWRADTPVRAYGHCDSLIRGVEHHRAVIAIR
jgi:hypothetical protein